MTMKLFRPPKKLLKFEPLLHVNNISRNLATLSSYYHALEIRKYFEEIVCCC